MDSSEQLLWSVQVDHQLFALQKLDVTVSFHKLCQDLPFYLLILFLLFSTVGYFIGYLALLQC